MPLSLDFVTNLRVMFEAMADERSGLVPFEGLRRASASGELPAELPSLLGGGKKLEITWSELVKAMDRVLCRGDYQKAPVVTYLTDNSIDEEEAEFTEEPTREAEDNEETLAILEDCLFHVDFCRLWLTNEIRTLRDRREMEFDQERKDFPGKGWFYQRVHNCALNLSREISNARFATQDCQSALGRWVHQPRRLSSPEDARPSGEELHLQRVVHGLSQIFRKNAPLDSNVRHCDRGEGSDVSDSHSEGTSTTVMGTYV